MVNHVCVSYQSNFKVKLKELVNRKRQSTSSFCLSSPGKCNSLVVLKVIKGRASLSVLTRNRNTAPPVLFLYFFDHHCQIITSRRNNRVTKICNYFWSKTNCSWV